LLRIREGRLVVHIHTSTGPSFLRKLFFITTAKITGCSVILHIHSGSFADYYKKKGFLFKAVIRRTLHCANTVVVLTESWVPVVLDIAPRCRRVSVVGNPVDVDKYKPAGVVAKRPPNGAECHLLFLGAIIETKGVYDIVESVSSLSSQGLKLRLTFAGD